VIITKTRSVTAVSLTVLCRVPYVLPFILSYLTVSSLAWEAVRDIKRTMVSAAYLEGFPIM
jgi:hypothetical protein